MMTHTFSQSRIIAVWLVLLAFLCCIMVPSLALAKKDMIIATEGDPEDGLDYSGGGSGILNGDTEQSPSSSLESNYDLFYLALEYYPKFGYHLIIPVYFQDYFKLESIVEIKWKANK